MELQFINPRCACEASSLAGLTLSSCSGSGQRDYAARVTVVVLCVCLSVCLSIFCIYSWLLLYTEYSTIESYILRHGYFKDILVWSTQDITG